MMKTNFIITITISKNPITTKVFMLANLIIIILKSFINIEEKYEITFVEHQLIRLKQ